MSVDSRRPSKAEEEPSKAEEDSNEVEPTGDFVLGNELRSSHKKNSWDVKAVLQNDSDQSIGLRWVDYSGNVKNATIVDPGDTWSMKSFNTWAWSIIEPESTKEITRVYFIDYKIPVSCKNLLSRVPEVEEEFDFEVASKAKSTYNKASSWKVHPAIKNDTDDDVLIKWIDYKGEAVRPHVCASGNRWGQSCYNTHPWSICNPETEQEITRVRFVKNGTVLLSQIFKAQGSSSKAHKLAEEQIHNPIADDAADEEDELTMVTGEDDSVVKCPSEELGSVYHKHQLEGFRVWLEEGVVEKNPNLIPRLTLDLREFNRVYPPDAVAMLQEKSGFWINHSRHFSDEKNPRSGMVTHWSRGWLRDKGDVQDKCGFVESYKASSYAVEFGIFKAVITHELSHAYHMWTRGKNDTMIKETYKKAIGEGLYDNGEYCGNPIKEGTWWTGKLNRRPYAAKNHHEYFAEACTSFFSSNRFRNGFYPYVHCELKNFDPHAYKMIEEAFGISGEDQVTRGEVPEDWLRKFAKIDFYAAREAVRAADVDGSGKLDFDEFASCIESLGVEGITNEEAAGLATFADANKDGVVDPEEVFTWLANHMGKKDETKEEA